MTVGSTKAMVGAASRAGYAVPAVNIVDYFSMVGVVNAAQRLRSPVILQTSVKTVRTLGVDVLSVMYRRVAESVDVPVALHLDHCPDREVLSQALAHGWGSVLFDASDRTYDQALTETIEVVAEAHAFGAAVESEIENIAGVEDDLGDEHEGSLYSIAELVRFVRKTRCDLFAPALGTAHGLYLARPTLHPERAAELTAVLGVPLVLHGGSGLTAAEFGEFIEAGCAKINVSTTLKVAYLRALGVAAADAAQANEWDPPTAFDRGGRAVADDIAAHIAMFRSGGVMA